MKDKQTIFKLNSGYYQIHIKILKDKGYIVVEDNEEYTVLELPDKTER